MLAPEEEFYIRYHASGRSPYGRQMEWIEFELLPDGVLHYVNAMGGLLFLFRLFSA